MAVAEALSGAEADSGIEVSATSEVTAVAEGAPDTESGSAGLAVAGTGLAAAALGLAAFKADRHPYGVGSLVADNETADYPDFYPVKGNDRIDGASHYYRPDATDYRAAPADVWFDSPSAAEAAGFDLAPTHPDGASGDDFEPGGSGHRWSVAEVEQERSRALYGPGWSPSTLSGQAEGSPTDFDVDKTAEVPAGEVNALIGGLPGAHDASDDNDDAEADPAELDGELSERAAGAVPRIGDLESSVEASVPDSDDSVDADEDSSGLGLSGVAAVAGGATVVAGGAALLGDALSGDGDADEADLDVDAAVGTGAADIDLRDDSEVTAAVDATKGKAGEAKGAAAAKTGKISDGVGGAKADATKAVKGGKAKGKELVGAGAGAASTSASQGLSRTRDVAGSVSGGSGGKGLAAGGAAGLGDRTGLGRWLWIGLAVLGLILLALLLSRCGSDGTSTEGAAVDGAGGDSAAVDSDEEASADEPASPTTIAASEAGDLRVQALAALGAAGFGDLDVEMDGDKMRLVGNVGSDEDAVAAEAALSDLEGMGDLENALIVGNAAASADEDADASASDDEDADADADAASDDEDADAAASDGEDADAAASDDDAASSTGASGEDDDADSGSGDSDAGDDASDDDDESETPTAEPVDGDPSYTG